MATRAGPGGVSAGHKLMQVMAGKAQGGAEGFFMRLAPALQRAGLGQRVAVRRGAGYAAPLRERSVDVIELPFGGRFDWRTGPALEREVTRYGPDILLSWMSRATRFCPRGPFVHAARLGGYYPLKYYRNCDHLIGNTRAIVDYLVREGWPAERAHYIPNFVDAAPESALDRATLDTPDEPGLILALGRLHANKAFDVLLRAMTRLPSACLWLAGEGPLRSELQGQAEALELAGRVRFLGWRDDIPALLAAADLLVCPSRHEPLGNVVVEAWAHDRPVVATASDGPRVLIEDSEAGLLVPVDDADALADAIARVLNDSTLAAQLVARGRTAYAAEFTEERVVARYFEFFDRVTG